MALYYYDKYTANYVSGGTSTVYTQGSWSSGGSGTIAAVTTVSGYKSYGFSSSSGYSLSGYWSGEAYLAGTLYSGGGSSISATSYGGAYLAPNGDELCNWSSASATASTTTVTNEGYYVQGSFIERIVAEDGTYPNNGKSGSYWYVKREVLKVPTTPTLISPNSNSVFNNIHTISWSASTDEDTPQAQLRYHIQMSTDGGTTYKDIVALTNAGVTSYQYDFTNEIATNNTVIRIRAFDGNNYSAWSSVTFSIVHKFKVGEYRANGIILPIYDTTMGMENKNQLRTVDKNGTVSCFELVDVTDTLASPFRVSTNSGVKAIAKE